MKNRIIDKRLHDTIQKILTERADLRDSDTRLITYIWWSESKYLNHDLKTISAVDFLNLLRSEAYSSHESIRRSRQKVQELHPETRGTKYRQRHKKAKQVRDYFSK